MATAGNSFFKFIELLQLLAFTLMLIPVESTLPLNLHHAPPKYSSSSTAVFLYGSSACANNGCSSTSCELDGQTLRSCPVGEVIEFNNLTVNSKHSFVLNVTARDGERNSSVYSWFIDTVEPTAEIFSKQKYINAEKVSIDITFSEACSGLGGFKCLNSSNCDLIVDGPAHVDVSSLRTIRPYSKYSLDIIISSRSTYGRVVVRLVDKFCTDKAGNFFKRTNRSVVLIHFDRRPVVVDLWMPVPSYVLDINGVTRTVLATNKMEDLKIFLDFSIPIKNSTEEVLKALHVNSDKILPAFAGNHGNRKFQFELKNVSSTEIITVELDSGLIIGRTGTAVSPVASLTILYDETKPKVEVRTSSPSITKASYIKVIVEFSKPVFGFEASMLKVEGGKIIRYKGLSKALHSLTVLPVAQGMISIAVPADKVDDISGNKNTESNTLEVKLYSTPAISVALYSFVTCGVIATSLTTAVISVSTGNLGVIGTPPSRNANDFASKPSKNLQGLLGHLQVFVLSDWISLNHPAEYSETTKGLRWLLPRQKLPWKEDCTSVWPNHFDLTEKYINSSRPGFLDHEMLYHPSAPLTLQHQISRPTEINQIGGRLQGHIGSENTSYGLPLNSREYFIHLLRGEPFSATNVVKRMENYNGWQDLEMNLFWLGLGGGILITIHVLSVLFLRCRRRIAAHGALSFPRFELLLLILMLPCMSQSSAFVIRGGTMGGIITGAFLMVVPAAFIVSIGFFLVVIIFSDSFSQYKEIELVGSKEQWYTKLRFFITGRPVIGKWFYREGLPSMFLPRFEILFENLRGPQLVVSIDQNDPSTISKWNEGHQTGIGRVRAVSSDESDEGSSEIKLSRVLGCVRSFYIVLDLLRRVGLGFISGTGSSNASSQRVLALAITLTQFIYLLTLKPYIRRGTHVAESVSLLCEAGIFGISIATNSSHTTEARPLGRVMLALLLLTFIAQVTNEWYIFTECILGLSHPQKKSLKTGLKFAAKGLVLPFLPEKHWPKVPADCSPQKTGLSVVPPLTRQKEIARRDTRAPVIDPLSSMTATVVPVLSPCSPVPGRDIAHTSSTPTRITLTDQKALGKKLRDMAKASFPVGSEYEEHRSASYWIRDQIFRPLTSHDLQASTSKARN
ncbi:hypothetical protein K2173_014237 [Erythroxylum novogranatense]|uniref:Bacterial Ig-like domain-containing protein n=1 Tax=Erythroxylum novogranatense TaxID=1862640 RepID=A0AAV8SDM4_9ROSI|nr:hypothetical protein K2173_014237 [Erythroxylum novogranatense]